MIRLNHNIQIGDKITIPRFLSWQAEEEHIEGEYSIISLDEEEKGWEGYAVFTLKRESDGRLLQADRRNLEYLSGEKVENADILVAIDPKEYQPEKGDHFRVNYVTKDDHEFGFWYLASRGDYDFLISSMVEEKWCYIKLPW